MHKKFGLLLGICCCLSNIYGQKLERYSFSSPHMGTTFRMVVFGEDSSKVATAVRAAFDRVEELNETLSDYLPDSELNRLSASAGMGQRIAVSDDLWKVLVRSQFFSKKSKGAFDITVGPLSRIWRRAMRKSNFPEQEKLQMALSKTGYKSLRLYKGSQSALLKKKGMKLDLGGIAKGYAIDQALEVLKHAGLSIALVDGGGDIALGDKPPGKQGWNIEVPAYSFPEDEKKDILSLSNCSIASSGDTYRYLEWEGVRYSHIIDPRTGYGISERRMLTVIAQDAMTADALASTLSVTGEIPQKKIRKRYRDNSVKTRIISWNP